MQQICQHRSPVSAGIRNFVIIRYSPGLIPALKLTILLVALTLTPGVFTLTPSVWAQTKASPAAPVAL